MPVSVCDARLSHPAHDHPSNRGRGADSLVGNSMFNKPPLFDTTRCAESVPRSSATKPNTPRRTAAGRSDNVAHAAAAAPNNRHQHPRNAATANLVRLIFPHRLLVRQVPNYDVREDDIVEQDRERRGVLRPTSVQPSQKDALRCPRPARTWPRPRRGAPMCAARSPAR